jgi:hypothetical protein
MKIALLICFILILASGAQDPYISRLQNEIDNEQVDSSAQLFLQSINAGQKAIPYLRSILLSDNKWKRRRAAMALAYIGGDNAISAINAACKLKNDDMEPYLCYASTSRGSKSDIKYLISALKSNERNTRDAAAFSLGVLRVLKAIPDLEQEGGSAALEAVRWMRSGPVSIKNMDSLSMPLPETDIIAAIFLNGIPRISHVSQLSD